MVSVSAKVSHPFREFVYEEMSEYLGYVCFILVFKVYIFLYFGL